MGPLEQPLAAGQARRLQHPHVRASRDSSGSGRRLPRGRCGPGVRAAVAPLQHRRLQAACPATPRRPHWSDLQPEDRPAAISAPARRAASGRMTSTLQAPSSQVRAVRHDHVRHGDAAAKRIGGKQIRQMPNVRRCPRPAPSALYRAIRRRAYMHPYIAQQLARDRIEQRLQQAQRARSARQLRSRRRADGSGRRWPLIAAKPRSA